MQPELVNPVFSSPPHVPVQSLVPTRVDGPLPSPLAPPKNAEVVQPSAPPSNLHYQAPQIAVVNVVQVNNVLVAPIAPPVRTLVVQPPRQPFLVRAVWFLAIGWWLSGITIVLAYLAILAVLTIPLGVWLLHRVPQIQTLRDRTREFQTQIVNGELVMRQGVIEQRSFFVRTVWFVAVGWWLTALWLSVAWIISLFILPLPLSIAMIDRAPGILTLQKH